MYCLTQNRVLSPDDFAVDLIIMIHTTRSVLTDQWFDSDGRSHQKLWQSRTCSIVGMPMVIRAICLPFLFCERLDMLNGGGRISVDIRNYTLMSVTREFALCAAQGTVKIEERQPERPIVYQRIKKLYRHRMPRKANHLCDSKGRPHVYKVLHEE